MESSENDVSENFIVEAEGQDIVVEEDEGIEIDAENDQPLMNTVQSFGNANGIQEEEQQIDSECQRQ